MGLFAIDVGIGDTLQAINGILARRESERATVWDSLEHQLQAVSLTVGELDRMYFALLAEIEAVFTQPEISRDRIDKVIDQATIYCTDGRLTLRLAECRGVIQEAAFNHALKHRRYRILTSVLRSIDDPLGRYINRLYHLQGGDFDNIDALAHPVQTEDNPEELFDDKQWDLRTVLELLKSAVQLAGNDKFGEGLTDAGEACEEAIRNYDRALSLALVQLVGHARQDLAMEIL